MPNDLLGGSFRRKQMISDLVNLFIINVTIVENTSYEHPLLRFNATLPELHRKLLKALKSLAHALIIRKAKVQQLERRVCDYVSGMTDSYAERLFNPGFGSSGDEL